MKSVIITSLLGILILSTGCAPAQSFDSSLQSIVKPYTFSMAGWEVDAASQGLKNWISGEEQPSDSDPQTVKDYFSLVDRIKTVQAQIAAVNAHRSNENLSDLKSAVSKLEQQRDSLQSAAQEILSAQIKAVLEEQGIANPLTTSSCRFPPLNFRLTELPHLLIISPRERIESLREITLRPDTTPAQIEKIEAESDKLGVSALVVELGGYGGTYPTMVLNEEGLRYTLDTIVEEWVHQYLALTPLGFRYVLDTTGISRNYDIATMNETVASMVSKEIGGIVYQQYYPEYAARDSQQSTPKPAFDFNKEMREIRKTVDIYLAQGQIETAESFMEQRRLYLAENGYYIRKLNQAYFAFHGTYADSPTSVSPIGAELRQLRLQSSSLKEFLDTVSRLTGPQDLKAKVNTD